VTRVLGGVISCVVEGFMIAAVGATSTLAATGTGRCGQVGCPQDRSAAGFWHPIAGSAEGWFIAAGPDGIAAVTPTGGADGCFGGGLRPGSLPLDTLSGLTRVMEGSPLGHSSA
jgi:hypothetical protein